MKHSEYQIIVENLSKQIEQCETALSKYNLNARDISKMTIKDLNESILSCRTALSEMDKFVKADLYHIIGMADLNAAQTSRIIKLTKELTSYRGDIKFVSGQDTILIPKKKKESTYKLSSGVKLVK
jgi:hypothetical protein|nr:MAG TPA: hypothetical protein [Caudoviricetes sp.]